MVDIIELINSEGGKNLSIFFATLSSVALGNSSTTLKYVEP